MNTFSKPTPITVSDGAYVSKGVATGVLHVCHGNPTATSCNTRGGIKASFASPDSVTEKANFCDKCFGRYYKAMAIYAAAMMKGNW